MSIVKQTLLEKKALLEAERNQKNLKLNESFRNKMLEILQDNGLDAVSYSNITNLSYEWRRVVLKFNWTYTYLNSEEKEIVSYRNDFDIDFKFFEDYKNNEVKKLDKEKIEISWFSTRCSESDKFHLFYLQFIGKVASILSDISKVNVLYDIAYNYVMEIQASINPLYMQISAIENEIEKIIKDEKQNELNEFINKYVRVGKEYYCGLSTVFNIGRKDRAKYIRIEKITDKTIQVAYSYYPVQHTYDNETKKENIFIVENYMERALSKKINKNDLIRELKDRLGIDVSKKRNYDIAFDDVYTYMTFNNCTENEQDLLVDYPNKKVITKEEYDAIRKNI